METSLGFIFFLILLLFPHQEMKMVVGEGRDEGGSVVSPQRMCDSKSHRFKGTCTSDTNCGNVCKLEGFHSGHCVGFRRRCFCKKPC